MQLIHALFQVNHMFVLFRGQIFTGKVLFDGNTSVETMVAIIGGKRPSRPTHKALMDRLWGLMQRCWAQDPHERLQMSEVLKILNPSSSPTPSSGMPLQLGESIYKMGVLTTFFYHFFYATILVVTPATDCSVFSTPQPPQHQDFATPACKRLVTHTSSQTEVTSLIEAIFASQDEIEMMDRLCEDDAQTFIDAIDKV